MGAYNSVAGATQWNVAASPNASSPTSGATNETFRISATTNTATTVEFTERLRDTLKFDSLDSLLVQMKADCDRAAELTGFTRINLDQ